MFQFQRSLMLVWIWCRWFRLLLCSCMFTISKNSKPSMLRTYNWSWECRNPLLCAGSRNVRCFRCLTAPFRFGSGSCNFLSFPFLIVAESPCFSRLGFTSCYKLDFSRAEAEAVTATEDQSGSSRVLALTLYLRYNTLFFLYEVRLCCPVFCWAKPNVKNQNSSCEYYSNDELIAESTAVCAFVKEITRWKLDEWLITRWSCRQGRQQGFGTFTALIFC